YEGIELGDAGPVVLITYMRTDSVHLAAEAIQRAADVIQQVFGDNYRLTAPRVFRTKSKGAQEAHEAIRPTDPMRLAADAAPFLSGDQLKLYRLIWERTVASQMADAQLHLVTADITARVYTFRASGTTVIFDGYLKALGERAALKETVLPPLAAGDTLTLIKLVDEQHFTQPPPRYSEATLVKALEEHGIGRPSTYAPTIDTVQQREYVVKNEEKRFAPTEIGTLVTHLLKDHFPNIVDPAFTAGMEENLDRIAAGTKEWQPTVSDFYTPFHQTIERKQTTLNRQEFTQTKTGEKCPDCGHALVIKLGRYGKFKACSNFPECKHTEPIGEEALLSAENGGETCPDCGRPLALKHGRFGPFLGCTGYPNCKHIKKIEKTTGITCPVCSQGAIVEKRSRRGRIFYACNRYPDCKNAYWSKPTGEPCPQCGSLLVAGAKSTTVCSNKECKFNKTADGNDQIPMAD
ncbi:MAG: type I DNA topoisomerase, partial [Candidatus Andersenbacteria bacterium]|nr:type I DNA topoisomerase [Candidatus Andersenbacteria bacterium]